jgi:DNA polymerase III delta prime subunit
VTVAKGIRAVIEQSYEGILRGSTRRGSASQPTSRAEGRNRQRMLERVQTIWITGVLEHSLYGRALITLGLSEESEVLANPWRLVMQEVDHPTQPLPTGTRITEVYDEAGGELLILGEPGSGKTTLLLELARDLLDRTRQDETHPIPVVFNLSSWTSKQRSLGDWLVEELNLKYQVPRKLGQLWVRDDQILLLLDGLDEVSSTDRSACVEAINAYRQEHGLLPMVVCSRNADYVALSKQVLLHRAVTIQPLTSQQIESYLSNAGEQLASVRAALHEDPALQELATTPLMLNVLTLAYQGTSIDRVEAGDSPEVRQRQVFSAYIERMLQRRSGQTRYSRQETMQWLGWLARQLSEHDQTEFYLERMQPDWLTKGWTRRFYSCVSGGLLGALLTAPVGGVISGLLSDWTSPLLAWWLGRSSSDLPWPWIPQLFDGLPPTLVSNLDYTVSGLLIGLLGGLLVGLLGGLLTGLLKTKGKSIKPAEVIVWSWRTLPWNAIASLVIGLIFVFFTGLRGAFVGVSIIPQSQVILCVSSLDISSLLDCTPSPVDLPSVLSNLFSYRLINGLIFGLVGGLAGLVLSRKLTNHHPQIPLQGKWESLGTGVIVGLVDWLFGLPLANAVSVLLDKPLGGLLHWSVDEPSKPLGILVGGLIGVLLCWLVGGLTLGLLNGFSHERLEKHLIMVPNQGIRRSAQISVSAGVLGGLACLLLFALGLTWSDNWSVEGLILGLFTGLFFALFVGPLVGLFFGGTAYIKHLLLRLFLWRMRCTPWNYSRFLDYAAERILLRKVGGGYIFVHRLLFDYFAALSTKDEGTTS